MPRKAIGIEVLISMMMRSACCAKVAELPTDVVGTIKPLAST
jgi:hypothetical protein